MLLLLDNQKVALSVTPVDAAGNPAKIDGVPLWSIIGAQPGILSLTIAADGLSCELFAAGPLGTAQVQVQADADLGAGVVAITGLLDVEVAAGQAVTLNIAAGVPENQ